jgi:hypothetical protein
MMQPPPAAPPLAGPLIQQPLQHLELLHATAVPNGECSILPPLSDAALVAAGAAPELLSIAARMHHGALRDYASLGVESATIAQADFATALGKLKTDAQTQEKYKNGGNRKVTGEDSASGETRLSGSDLPDESEDEQISSDSDEGPPPEVGSICALTWSFSQHIVPASCIPRLLS